MVIGFNPQFVPRILSGQKKHTIRKDSKNRWKVGTTMHMATGVRTKKYSCFAEAKCEKIQYIEIDPVQRKIKIRIDNIRVFVPNARCLIMFAQNEGFATIEDFWEWFDKPFKGKILYWNYVDYQTAPITII